MILRNVAVRHGRKALASPLNRSSLRSLTTEVSLPLSQPPPPDSNSLHLTKSFKPHPPKPPPKAPPQSADKLSGGQIKRNFSLKGAIRKTTAHLGSRLEPQYAPHQVLVDPPKPEDVTLELLMASQSHLGHSTSLWNPMNQRYIFGVRQGVHIISLETTAAHLRRAAKVVEGVAYHGGLILFVGTRAGQAPCVVQAARISKGCHLFDKWTPGSITNGDQILAKCEIKAVGPTDEFIEGYEDKLADWKALKPDLVVCLNPLENYVLLHECGLNNIPTIGIIDTDADPTWVTYPIPANDDSLRCVQVIAGVLGRAGQEGQRLRLEAAERGEVTWQPPPDLGKPYDAEEEKRLKREAEVLAQAKERAERMRKMRAAQPQEVDLDPAEHEL